MKFLQKYKNIRTYLSLFEGSYTWASTAVLRSLNGVCRQVHDTISQTSRAERHACNIYFIRSIQIRKQL